MDDSVDYYAVLGVSPDADLKTITTAYRQAALKAHPDKNPGQEAAVLFARLTTAYRLLSDQAARNAYDRVRSVKEAQRRRHAALSAERQALRRELLEKEDAWRRKREGEERAAAERQLKQEMDRLAAEAAIREREERQQRREGREPLFTDEQLSLRFTFMSAPDAASVKSLSGCKAIHSVSGDGMTGIAVFQDPLSAQRAIHSQGAGRAMLEWVLGRAPSASAAIDRVTGLADLKVEDAMPEEELEQLTLLRLGQLAERQRSDAKARESQG